MLAVISAMCLTAVSLATAAGEVNNTYFIVAPSVFRPGQPYKLRVTLSSTLSSSVNIECGIMDRMKKQIILGQSGVFSPGENLNSTLPK